MAALNLGHDPIEMIPVGAAGAVLSYLFRTASEILSEDEYVEVEFREEEEDD